MIRINLLAVERERTKRRSGGISLAQRVTIACSLILVVTVAGIGWWFWTLHQQAQALDRDIVAAEQEIARLRSVLTQVQQYETQRAQLQQRVALIEELQRDRTGPVHMLDEVSRSLPDRLWLVDITEKESVLTIDGRTTVLTALSDFVANLEASGYFKRPVEIVSTQVEAGQQSSELIRFNVRAEFSPPGAPAKPPAAPAAAR
jgi:type IV pilus assembly protein PilN